jgi:hypothetical protein
MNNNGPVSVLHRHLLALVLFPLLSLLWVGDTLFKPVDLSAFDVINRLPHWQAEHEYRGVQQLILSDSPQAHYPERALKWRAVRNGGRVDFNPYIFNGMPEHSQGAGGFITSSFQLFMDVSDAIDWSTWFRLAVAGLFMYAFLASLGVGKHPAILGGVLWAFSFHHMGWLLMPQHLGTQLWIPVLLYFNCAILRRGATPENVVGILVSNALFFTSGYTQIVLYTYVAIGIFNTVYLATASGFTFARRLQRWSVVHLVFILSALSLTPILFAELQFLDEGLRGQQHWRPGVPDLGWGSATLATTAKNMLPAIGDYKRLYSANFFGGLWGEKYWGKSVSGNVVTASIYTSVLIFVLIPAALVWLRDSGRRPLILASCAVLMFAFAMIHRDPLILNLFSLIPHSGHGGYSRYTTIIVFFLALMAALGLHVLTTLHRRNAQYLFWTFLGLAAASPLLVQLVDRGLMLSSMAYPLLVLAATAVAVAALSFLRLWHHVPAVLILVAVIDLLIVGYDFNPRMEKARNFPLTATLEHLIDDDSAYRVAEVSRRQLYPPNILQYYGIPSITGYSTVAPYNYIEFVDRTVGEHHVTANGQLFLFETNLDIFRLLNVKYVISQDELTDARVKQVRQAPGYQVYELRDPLPRVFCAGTLSIFESGQAVLESFRELIAEHDRPVAVVGDVRSTVKLTPNCRVRDISAYLNGVEFTVSSDAASYVFVPYNHYPHWKARSDGESVPVLKANLNFIALPIEAGEQRIRLIYEDPIHLFFSASLIGLGIVVLGWFARTRSRTLAAWLLAYAGVVLILYNLLEIPGVANMDLPERPDTALIAPHG